MTSCTNVIRHRLCLICMCEECVAKFVWLKFIRSFCFQVSGTIVHSSKLCLDRADIKSGGSVVVKPCSGADSQKWEFEHYISADFPSTTMRFPPTPRPWLFILWHWLPIDGCLCCRYYFFHISFFVDWVLLFSDWNKTAGRKFVYI